MTEIGVPSSVGVQPETGVQPRNRCSTSSEKPIRRSWLEETLFPVCSEPAPGQGPAPGTKGFACLALVYDLHWTTDWSRCSSRRSIRGFVSLRVSSLHNGGSAALDGIGVAATQPRELEQGTRALRLSGHRTRPVFARDRCGLPRETTGRGVPRLGLPSSVLEDARFPYRADSTGDATCLSGSVRVQADRCRRERPPRERMARHVGDTELGETGRRFCGGLTRRAVKLDRPPPSCARDTESLQFGYDPNRGMGRFRHSRPDDHRGRAEVSGVDGEPGRVPQVILAPLDLLAPEFPAVDGEAF